MLLTPLQTIIDTEYGFFSIPYDILIADTVIILLYLYLLIQFVFLINKEVRR
mgnify:FL=1